MKGEKPLKPKTAVAATQKLITRFFSFFLSFFPSISIINFEYFLNDVNKKNQIIILEVYIIYLF